MEARRRLLARAVVQFGSFVLILGIPDGILGVLWPSMRHGLHRPLADLGELVLAGTVLYLAGGLTGDAVRRSLGLRATLVCATLLGLGSLTGWALAPDWWVILVSLAALGYVKGVLDAVLNAVAATDGGVRRLGFLHASWAVGGTLGPVLVATLATAGHWRPAIAAIAIGVALLVPFAVISPGDAPVAAADPEAQPAGGRAVPVAGIVATTVAFIAYTAAESGPVSWGATYLESDRHETAAAAAVAMAVFWAALTLGRLGLALPQRFAPAQLLEASCLVFVAGAALFWLLPGGLAIVGLGVAGLGSAAIFPLYVALTPARLGEHVTGKAVGYAIAGAALGAPLAVGGFGLLAAHFGTAVLGPCVFGAAALMYLAHRLLARVVAPPATPPAALG